MQQVKTNLLAVVIRVFTKHVDVNHRGEIGCTLRKPEYIKDSIATYKHIVKHGMH